MENEFQTAIEGRAEDVDLPCRIKDSSFFKNVRRRVHSGDMPQRCEKRLDDYISCNDQNVWESSWASFPRSRLNAYAESVLERDLLADKNDPSKGKRADWKSFDYKGKLSLPVSYILKLALADVIGLCEFRNSNLRKTGERLLDHFLNDNTSPEIHSFYVSPMKQSRGMGKAAARETLQRFLVIQLLVAYANKKFNTSAGGQMIKLYFAPHPPVRQKQLNQLIPDSFYRNLFMSPCLSGWDKGEEKMEYMGLCHRVMSRSHLNTIHKLREAGIINNDLVVMPNTSNISLANNGTHISLGSRKLSGILAAGHQDFGAAQEKHLGDLVIKIVEHFLPLFVGTCSAAPYRLDFEDFHPEKILGFLSHELDFTHLRMIWRRWKKKAQLKFLGHPFRPYGPQWLDSKISRLFLLKGDYIPDFRLIDYLVALMSTDENPALDGMLGNDTRLKNDLQDCGVFDSRMSLYLLYKLRQHSVMGFSGFEGRFYSLFHSLRDDMAVAADMQLLITALAYKYVLSGKIKHEDIADTPDVESSRRQIFFGCAIGLPTFFVHQKVKDSLLLKIVSRSKKVRQSSRYPNYLRAYTRHYQEALIDVIKEDAADLIEMMDLHDSVRRIEECVKMPADHSVSAKLTREICGMAGIKNPLSLRANEYNAMSEKYYRDVLRISHLKEALEVLADDCRNIDYANGFGKSGLSEEIGKLMDGENTYAFFKKIKKPLLDENLPEEELARCLLLSLAIIESHSNNKY